MFDSLAIWQMFAVGGIIILAYLVRGIAGFGSGLIAIPLLAMLLPLSVVVPTVVLLDYLASAGHGIQHRESIQWPEIFTLIPFAAIGVVSALFLFKTIDAQLLLKALGVFIVLYALYSFFSIEIKTQFKRLWAVPAGTLAGFIGTLFGTGGPFYVLYLQSRKLGKTEFRATFATVFLFDGFARLTGYLATGFFSLNLLKLIIIAIPIMVVSMYIGGKIHTSLSQETFQRGISVLLVVSGLSLLLK